MIRAFRDEYLDKLGFNSIYMTLHVAPSAYRRHAALCSHRELRSSHAKRNEILCADFSCILTTNRVVYGADTVWRQIHREEQPVVRCTVEAIDAEHTHQGRGMG